MIFKLHGQRAYHVSRLDRGPCILLYTNSSRCRSVVLQSLKYGLQNRRIPCEYFVRNCRFQSTEAGWELTST